MVLNPDHPEDGSGFDTTSEITKHCRFQSKLFHYSTIVILYLWESRIEIKYYSVTYFECITEFDVL